MHTIDSAATERSVVIGPSGRMRAVFDFLRVIAHSESTVVITARAEPGKK